MVELASSHVDYNGEDEEDSRKRRVPKTESRRSKLIWPLKTSAAQLLSSPARSFNVDSGRSIGALHRALSSLVRNRHKEGNPPPPRTDQLPSFNARNEAASEKPVPENDVELTVRQTEADGDVTSSASIRVLSMGERGRWGAGNGIGDAPTADDAVSFSSSRSFHCRTYAVPSPATSPEVTGDENTYRYENREEFHDLRRLRCGRRILSGGGSTPTSAKSFTGGRRSAASQTPVFRPKSSFRRRTPTEYDIYYNTSWATAEPIRWDSCSPEYDQPSCIPASNPVPSTVYAATAASGSEFASPDLQFNTYNFADKNLPIFSAPPTYGRKQPEAPCFSPPTDEHGNPTAMSWQDRYLLLCQAIATRAFEAQKSVGRGYSCAPCDCSSCEMSFSGDTSRRPASFSIPAGDRLNLGSGHGVDLDTFSGPLGYVSDSKLSGGAVGMYELDGGGAGDAVAIVATPSRRRRRWWKRVPSMLAKASPANYIIYLGAGHRRGHGRKIDPNPPPTEQPPSDIDDSCSHNYFSGPVASYNNFSGGVGGGGVVAPPDSQERRQSSSKRWSFGKLWRFIKRV